MPEALRGTLDQNPLPDILSFLSNGKKTGCLSLRNGGDVGEIFLRDGEIVHVTAGADRGEHAFYELARWVGGDFSFEPEVEAPEESVATTLHEILTSAKRQVDEWQEIRRVIPDDSAAFRFSPTGVSDQLSLRTPEWQVLAQVDGVRTAAEIADLLGLEKMNAMKILAQLVTNGLVQATQGVVKTAKSKIDAVFFDQLSAEFTDLMGPIGPVIIDEEIAAMGESRDTFTRDRIAELVERLSESIEDESKRLHFQRIMLDVMRKL